MGYLDIEDRIQQLHWGGYSPIHLWGSVYLVKYFPDLPFYMIKKFKD